MEPDRAEVLINIGPLGDLKLGFGKYAGRCLWDIPLRYLDETISVMPPKWNVRAAQRFVGLCMLYIAIAERGKNGGATRYRGVVPSISFRQWDDTF